MGGVRGTYRGTKEVHTGFWCENLREIEHLEDLRVDGRLLLKCIFMKCHRKEWIEFIWLGIRTDGGLCECGNEPSDSIKCEGILE
jgi:hypothetical protein